MERGFKDMHFYSTKLEDDSVACKVGIFRPSDFNLRPHPHEILSQMKAKLEKTVAKGYEVVTREITDYKVFHELMRECSQGDVVKFANITP